jgi:hypothetical protein
MESITYAVQDAVQLTEELDGMDKLAPMPSSIKDQMPVNAQTLQELATNMGREFVAVMVKASIDLRKAYDRDDRAAVSEVYARGNGWITSIEGGYQLGVPDAHMSAFAKRHRGQR